MTTPAAAARLRLVRRRPSAPIAAANPAPVHLPIVTLVAAGGALTLAVSSRGDGLVLAVALATVAVRPVRIAGAVGALLGSLLRWGTTSLGAIAGAQAVLGPAGWTGSGAAVASAWAGALALVAATPGRLAPRGGRALAAAPFGATAALVVIGPGPGGAVGLRVVAAVAASALAWLVAGARERRVASLAIDVLAVVAGVTAAVLGARA